MQDNQDIFGRLEETWESSRNLHRNEENLCRNSTLTVPQTQDETRDPGALKQQSYATLLTVIELIRQIRDINWSWSPANHPRM